MEKKLTKMTLTGKRERLWGDCSGLTGDLDACDLTDDDRTRGVNIGDLVIG